MVSLFKVRKDSSQCAERWLELLPELRSKDGGRMKVVLDDGAFMPTRAHDTDAGLDLYSPVDIMIPGRGDAIIDTGVHIEIPELYAGFLMSKSGLNVKHGITSEGVIDAGYTGSVVAKLYNSSYLDYKVNRGDKITQLIVIPVCLPELELVDRLGDTERGANGFGSTGK